MNFRYCLSPYCFSDEVVRRCMGLSLKGPWFTFAHTEIGSGASFALLNKGRKISRVSTSSTGTQYSPIWTLLSLSWSLYRTNAARSKWTWGTSSTIYHSASRQFDLYSRSSRSCRFNSGHGFTNDFIRIVGRYLIRSTNYFSKTGWVYFWYASW